MTPMAKRVPPLPWGSLTRHITLLEQFLAKDTGRGSPLLWRLLLWVTHTRDTLKGEVQGHGVNTVFYRALQICPSVKVLFLDSINYILKWQ